MLKIFGEIESGVLRLNFEVFITYKKKGLNYEVYICDLFLPFNQINIHDLFLIGSLWGFFSSSSP